MIYKYEEGNKKTKLNKFLSVETITYFFVFSFILYAILHSIISHTRIDLISLGVIVGSLSIIGVIKIIAEKKVTTNFKIEIKDLDIPFTAIGVILTYELATLFPINVVVASAFMGLIGYLTIKKHSVAFYCGSFAGMTSYEILNHYEIIILALICAMVYVFIKKILSGYGGKLGTVAFVSTTITAIILGRNYLPVIGTYNVYLIFIFSVAGVALTYLLNIQLKQSVVLSSALPSLIVAIIIQLFWQEGFIYAGLFFTASFIGMSDNKKLPNIFVSIILGLILGFVFILMFDYFNGFGGKMGLMALISLLIYQGIKQLSMMLFLNKSLAV